MGTLYMIVGIMTCLFAVWGFALSASRGVFGQNAGGFFGMLLGGVLVGAGINYVFGVGVGTGLLVGFVLGTATLFNPDEITNSGQTRAKGLFDLGKVTGYEKDLDTLSAEKAKEYVMRHISGDFGEITERRRESNLAYIKGHGNGEFCVVSEYPRKVEKPVEVMTLRVRRHEGAATYVRVKTPEESYDFAAPYAESTGRVALGGNPSRYVPQSVKIAVATRDMGRCRHCGSTSNLAYDHITPYSRGGTSVVDNIQLLCQRCNSRKGNRWSG